MLRTEFIEGSMMYRAVHKLMIVGEYELAEVDAVSKAIDYNRLNRTLQEWRAANAVTAMNPAAETYMLKNLSELRSYAVIRLRVLKRIMSHICILTAQLGLNADSAYHYYVLAVSGRQADTLVFDSKSAGAQSNQYSLLGQGPWTSDGKLSKLHCGSACLGGDEVEDT